MTSIEDVTLDIVVVKRDGKKVPFDGSKIALAIKKGFDSIIDEETNEKKYDSKDIQKIYPEVVSKNENGYLSVDYSKLSIIALAAIDKLNERIKELECQIKL